MSTPEQLACADRCEYNYSPVCTSSNKTYANECIARCMEQDAVLTPGACTNKPPSAPRKVWHSPLLHFLLMMLITGVTLSVNASSRTLRALLLLYAVQLSPIVHELGHAISAGRAAKPTVHIPWQRYVPLYGYFFRGMHTRYGAPDAVPDTLLRVSSQMGFAAHIVYVVVMSWMLSKTPWGAGIAMAGMLVYMFVYPWTVPVDGNDFQMWKKK